jgi:hypothetical protein
MKLIDELKVTGPAFWASYFINGDASSFDYSNTPDNPDAGDNEQSQADAFLKWACGTDDPNTHGEIVSCSDESFFAWRHDATQFGALACDCVEYTVLIYRKD